MKKTFAFLASAKLGFSLTKTVLLFFFLPFLCLAQIVIEERVDIDPVQTAQGNNPMIVFPDSLYGGSGNKPIMLQPQYQPDNPQSTIYLPEGGKVTARVIFSEAAGTAKIDLEIRQPEQQTLVEYANRSMGFTWTSPGYPPGANVEFGIYWYYNSWGTIYQGNEAGAIMTQTGPDKYEIGFEAAGDDWDYNELVIEVTTDECDEEIVYATSNEPQELSPDASEIIKLRSDSYWIWTDKNGDPQITQIGDVIENHPIGAGVTKFLEKIAKNSEVEWNFGDDLVINPLLDTIALNPEEYRWIFNVSNLRIPILSDYSKFLLTPYPDIKDGTDTTLLATYIISESLYNRCLQDLSIFIDGVYSHIYELDELYFAFTPGSLLHEEHHFLMEKRFVPKKLNSFTFPIIRNLNAKKSEYPCPKNTINKNETIILHLYAGIRFGGDLFYAKDEEIDISGYSTVRMKKGDGYVDKKVENFELAADKYASEFYETALGRIIEWWKNR